eukprot:352715-Chlamydomonas_euryale.AAC.7
MLPSCTPPPNYSSIPRAFGWLGVTFWGWAPWESYGMYAWLLFLSASADIFPCLFCMNLAVLLAAVG